METIELQMNEYLPLREVVFQTLRQAILRGQLQPGERLMEIHLAKQLGVSRTPVREAIHKLEVEGLVITYPRRGAVVAEITVSDMEDVLEVRGALEELAVRKAASRMNAEQIEQLKAAAQEFEECTRHDDLTKSALADVKFHEIISEATGNQRLIALLNNLRGQIYRYRLENLKDRGSYGDLLQHHAKICEAMELHDEDGAAKILQEHIEIQRQSILSKLHKR